MGPIPQTAGERWTADALTELRGDGYSRTAWIRFLRASLERSGQTRRAHPALALQARRWGALGAAGWLLGCGVMRRSAASADPLPGLLWWLSVWRMLDWHLGMAEAVDGTRRERLSSADALSLARLWLVPALFAARGSPQSLSALILAGGLSDLLDGELARRHGCTRLGRDLDTAADICFLSAAAAAAWTAGRLPGIGAWCLGLRHAVGFGAAVQETFVSSRRPPGGARRWGAVLRVGGLALVARGRHRSGTVALVGGCLVPPRQIRSPSS